MVQCIDLCLNGDAENKNNNVKMQGKGYQAQTGTPPFGAWLLFLASFDVFSFSFFLSLPAGSSILESGARELVEDGVGATGEMPIPQFRGTMSPHLTWQLSLRRPVRAQSAK
jgi:hypothetical protein